MALDALKFMMEEDSEPRTRIRVLGVGGGGSNAVARMLNEGLTGVEFCVLNTDAQALAASPVPQQAGHRLQNHQRSRRRFRSFRRPSGRARGYRAHHRSSRRRRHGLRHRGPWRRHRHRRRSRGGVSRERTRRAHCRRRHQAVRLRRPAPSETGRTRAGGTGRRRRHGHHHSERPAPRPGSQGHQLL